MFIVTIFLTIKLQWEATIPARSNAIWMHFIFGSYPI